jgi:hypothetical protein
MTTATIATSPIIQGGGGATPRPATTSQNPTSGQDLQNAAHDLREAIRDNINQEINAQRAQAAAKAAATQAASGATPPPTPHRFRIQGPDGQQTIVSVPPFGRDTIPPQAVDITVAFFLTIAIIVIGLPLARAFARRMDRRSGPAQIPNEISSQLAHLNQAVDAIALEVERISEGQRYTTRLLSDQRDTARQTLPSGVDR